MRNIFFYHFLWGIYVAVTSHDSMKETEMFGGTMIVSRAEEGGITKEFDINLLILHIFVIVAPELDCKNIV